MPNHPLTPQTTLMRVSRIFSEFQLCIGLGEGELQENFQKDAKEKAFFMKEPRKHRLNMNTALLSQGLLSMIVCALLRGFCNKMKRIVESILWL